MHNSPLPFFGNGWIAMTREWGAFGVHRQETRSYSNRSCEGAGVGQSNRPNWRLRSQSKIYDTASEVSAFA